MQYVYVLTSTQKDYYYEQCLMSVFSLRHYMNDAQIIILTDNKTNLSFETTRCELKKLASKIISVDFSEQTSNIERSRILKTTIPSYVNGDFLFIDCDTIICESLSNIENYNFPISAVLDGHVMLSEHKHRDYFVKREKKLGFSGTKSNGFHLNSGVMLFRDCDKSREFFKKWNKLWSYSFYEKKDHHDQSAFNEAWFRMNFSSDFLPGEWNCQLSQGGLSFLKDAKIIHYFSSETGGKHYIPYYKLAEKSVVQSIKDTGIISEEIKEMILNPKFQFNKVHIINDSRIINIIQSPITFTIAEMKEKLPFLFMIMEKTTACIRMIGKKIKGKK